MGKRDLLQLLAHLPLCLFFVLLCVLEPSYEEEDICMSYEEEDTYLPLCLHSSFCCVCSSPLEASMSVKEEDTCMPYEEEDTCMSYEEEDTCLPLEAFASELECGYMRQHSGGLRASVKRDLMYM
jgi:hypothetical protein